MTASAVGDELLVNELVIRSQTTEGAATPVAVSEANRIVVFSGNGPTDRDGVFARLYDSSGEKLLDVFRVNATVQGEQHSASVASDADGNFVVVWAGRGVGDKDGILMQRFGADGTALDGETLVNSIAGGSQYSPAIAMQPNGSFAVAWSGAGEGDAAGVFMQRFDASGSAEGDQQRVNTTTVDRQTDPAMVFDSDGGLVVAWSSRHQDGSDWGIYGQRFDADGEALGDEFAWNSTTADSQHKVSLAAGPDGEVVAAWQSHGQDGDGWTVVARSLDGDGTAQGDEIVLDAATAGHQRDASIAVAEDGQWLAAWSTSEGSAAGWEVMARTFVDGNAEGDAFVVSGGASGDPGHQHYSSVAVAGDVAAVVWAGRGTVDRAGVYLQEYEVELVDDGPQVAPELAEVEDGTAEVGSEFEITVTATDANTRDDLTFSLDPDNSPSTATIERLDNNSAVIRWTPAAEAEGETFTFRVIVTDDGEPPMADTQEFAVTVGEVPVAVDLNGSGQAGSDTTATFVRGGGTSVIVGGGLTIVGAEDGMVSQASAVLNMAPDGAAETLTVDVLDTDITAGYDVATRTLTLSGADTAVNYARVLRTLSYNNTADMADGERTVAVRVTDATGTSDAASTEITLEAIDLVALAEALADAGVTFYGAAWCPDCTEQKELFEDGGQFLPFVEVTNPDRSPNQVAMDNDIDVYPTWEFAAGTRLEGPQSLQALADAAGIDFPTSNQPFLAPIPDDTLLIGSPLHVPLDGYDPTGGPLTYTVTTDNPDVTAEVLTGNRSMRIDVAGFGDMVFELFEGRATRATDHVIELAEDDFYDDVIFHRVIDGFVIQGGDPTGTGTGGSTLGEFDDQFHVDLQHNRAGLLSFAKSGDDTNDSQFFITDGESASLRNLDFNHTIFGILTEGESNRQAISNTAVSGPANSPRPVSDVVMEDVEIFEDIENATLMLKAAEGATGPVNVTVTVADQHGNTFQRTFEVEVEEDTVNGRPFLHDIDPVSIPANTTAEIQLAATDVEGDPIRFEAVRQGSVDYTFDVSDDGLLTVTPPTDFVGTLEIGVVASREVLTGPGDFDLQILAIEVV